MTKQNEPQVMQHAGMWSTKCPWQGGEIVMSDMDFERRAEFQYVTVEKIAFRSEDVSARWSSLYV